MPTHGRKKVVIIGNTSKFHLMTRLNYGQFSKLVHSKYDVLHEETIEDFLKIIKTANRQSPWVLLKNAGIRFIKYPSTSKLLMLIKKTNWWHKLLNSDIIIVHGEGMTESATLGAYYYLCFSEIARELSKESWLVNFSMYEAEPFVKLLRQFSFIACRDILTYEHLKELKINTRLSFDCCILGTGIENYVDHNNTIAALKGANDLLSKNTMRNLPNIVKYNCCWRWKDNNAISYSGIQEYIDEIKKSMFSLSSTFHGNILSYICGIPWVSLDNKNKKYHSLDIELLPKQGENITLCNYRKFGSNDGRKRIRDHFVNSFYKLKERALLNCP